MDHTVTENHALHDPQPQSQDSLVRDDSNAFKPSTLLAAQAVDAVLIDATKDIGGWIDFIESSLADIARASNRPRSGEGLGPIPARFDDQTRLWAQPTDEPSLTDFSGARDKYVDAELLKLLSHIGTRVAEHVWVCEEKFARTLAKLDLLKSAVDAHLHHTTENNKADLSAAESVWTVRRASDETKASAASAELLQAASPAKIFDYEKKIDLGAQEHFGDSESKDAQLSSMRTIPEALQEAPDVIGSEFGFRSGWTGRAWPQQATELMPDGVVRAANKMDRAGLVTSSFPLEGGGLIEVQVVATQLSDARLILKITTDAGEGVGPDFCIMGGEGLFTAFAPQRTKKIKFFIYALATKPGDVFRLSAISIRRVSTDEHLTAVRESVVEPIIASLASIPGRRTMLADCVNSLLVQCDQVRVFLNNYPDIPEFLIHPRVEVCRSQDWDDRGDAGKVFWLDREKEPGFRLIVDDDLIFPPDFSIALCRKVAEKNKRAIYATHGILIRQPLNNYYDDLSRAATFHFGRELAADRHIHIGATNALCLHSSVINMRWDDFRYCNSADIWLALHAQHNNIEVLTPARPNNWVRENRHEAPEETIYKHSRSRTGSRFDSSLIQDAVLKHAWPLTLKTAAKPKCGILLLLTDDRDHSRWISDITTVGDAAEWVLMLAIDRTNAEAKKRVGTWKVERETHLLDYTSKANVANQALELMKQIDVDELICLDSRDIGASSDDQVRSAQASTWAGAQVISLLSEAGGIEAGALITLKADQSASMASVLSKLRVVGRAFHAPVSDVIGVGLPAHIQASLARDSKTVNGFFDRTLIMNLDRRPDRWQRVKSRMDAAGIVAERFSAIDGSSAQIRDEYEAYCRLPTHVVSPHMPRIKYAHDLYMNYPSQMTRVAHLEAGGKKAIASAGAWGYLRSYEKILEDALRNGTERLLVFDDDVVLHSDFERLFAECIDQLPNDWLILQLGTLQYNWSEPWAEWYSERLYRTNGSAIGSHAVGIRFDLFPNLLDHVKRYDMPFDIGALSAATRAFPDKCFVTYPNLAIQEMLDTDIGTSNFQKSTKREAAAATYRWDLTCYR